MVQSIVKTSTNLERIERVESTVMSIAETVSEILHDALQNIDNLDRSIPLYRMPSVLLDTLTLWEKLDKIKTTELKRSQKDKPQITGSLSEVSTASLLAILEIDNSEDLLEFLDVESETIKEHDLIVSDQ